MNQKTIDNEGVALDEGLDAEDVAAATQQQAEETHIGTGKVRSAYYNSYCYLRDLEDAGLDLKDPRLEELAREALNNLQHIYDHLEDKYQWD